MALCVRVVATALLLAVLVDAQLDPSEFFKGSQRRPKLEIVYPDNGQVLDDTSLDIRIRVTGYDVPSLFHDSSICVALSATGQHSGGSEHCFDQTPDLVFHAKGLSPGSGYSLRIVFYERGKAIAMSVRSFRVAGITGVSAETDEAVTIQTALQIAVQHQTIGMHVEAERIYRNILRENPSHPYALHLLGIIFYQKGQPSLAIPFIEQALSAFKDEGLNTSTMAARDLDNFHNTLGECYRVLGRVTEAEREFRVALSINPSHYSAEFNLGLTYQQMNRWDEAIARYTAAQALAALYPTRVDRKSLLECKIRQCDLLQAKDGGLQGWHALHAARACWEEGLRQFPRNGIMHNELGNVLVQLGEAEAALESYRTAQDLGNDLAEQNIATVLEILGYVDEARALFAEAATTMKAKGLSTHHVMLKKALLLPRVMPAAQSELTAVRTALEGELDRLLRLPAVELVPTNASPLSFGFSLGYFLAFHGQNNVAIKTKLHRLFSRFCPALPSGRFIDEVVSLRGLTPADGVAALVAAGSPAGTANEVAAPAQESEVVSAAVTPGAGDTDGFDDSSAATGPRVSAAAQEDGGGGPIRVGFASRYFSDGHSVGALAIRVIELLSLFNRGDNSDPSKPTFHVSVYLVAAGRSTTDSIQARVIEAADKIVFLPADLNTCAAVMRRARLHVLVYPEIGIDPVTYFLAYGQLAATQVAWLGHPESTGLPSVQWFVSVDVEAPDPASRFSENVRLMRGLSSCFTDEDTHLAQELHASPRNVLLHRAKFLELLGVPRAAHLYLVAEPLYKLHGQFDEAVSSILLQDKLAYLLILDSANRRSWQQLYVDRMAGRFSGSVRERIVFYVTGGQGPDEAAESRDTVIRAMAAAHVLLDPFPAAGYREPLRALGLGLPVVTLPSGALGGRMTLAMYSQMQYTELIAGSVNEYVSLAMALAHKPKYRQQVVTEILSRVPVLFQCAAAERDWVGFLSELHAAATHVAYGSV